ncbi:protein enabled isoform X2 [Homalodisca vitripennis]|nr:protein enabled isoform X2 [Homalodisca vitripennis]
MSEQSIASARASVMVYDDVQKKWIPSGSSSGLSKVHIFQHQINNSFRVVGRKLQDHEVVINCAIIKGLKYNQATNTFHQWRDNKQVYGLNFSNKEDADNFARAMFHALDVLSNAIARPVAPPPPPQPAPPPQPPTTVYQQANVTTVYQQANVTPGYQQSNVTPGYQQANVTPGYQQSNVTPGYQQANGQYEEEATYSTGSIGSARGIYHQVSPGGPQRIDLSPNTHSHSRTLTREDAAQIQERRMSQQNQMISSPNASSPQGPPVPATPPGQGHHRTSSAPPAPQPPPMSLAAPLTSPPPPVPPAPPCPPPPWSSTPSPAMGPPPPPPPPAPNMSRSSSSDGPDQGSLAAQLQSARLRRSNKQSAENSGSSTSSSGSNYGTLGRSQTGMASMMDEMAKTLARRRAAAEKKDPADIPQQDTDCSTGERKGSVWGPAKLGNGCESSPKPSRKQLNSSTEELQAPRVNGDQSGSVTSADLEALKQDILRDMRKEINKMKQDIIDSIKVELSRR